MNRGWLLCCLLALLLGCPPSSSHGATLRAPRPKHVRCAIGSDRLQCGPVGRELTELGVALPLRASAPRRLGGLWLLDAAHTLTRVDARGRVTGREPEAGEKLLVSAEYVCTLADSSALRCRVDHHDDAGCDARSPLAAATEVEPGFTPTELLPGALLCGASAEGGPRCARLSRPCARGCLRFPACGAALRCIEGCSPGQPPIAAEPVEPTFRSAPSSFRAARVTHAHGRQQGGYAGARARP